MMILDIIVEDGTIHLFIPTDTIEGRRFSKMLDSGKQVACEISTFEFAEDMEDD